MEAADTLWSTAGYAVRAEGFHVLRMWFPNNVYYGHRVEQLSSDIVNLQEQIRRDVQDAYEHDAKAIELVKEIAKDRGFATLDELIATAASNLNDRDWLRYRDVKKEVEYLDEGIRVAMDLVMGLAGLAQGISFFFIRELVAIGFRAIGLSLTRLVVGRTEDGTKLLQAASNIFTKVLKDEVVVGRAASAFRVIQTLGKIVVILGVIFKDTSLDWDPFSELRQRAQLKEWVTSLQLSCVRIFDSRETTWCENRAIKELCVARLQVKKTREYTRVISSYCGDLWPTLDFVTLLQALVREGVVRWHAPNEKFKNKIEDWAFGMKKDFDDIQDRKVYDDLQRHDEERLAWTYEDPSYGYIVDTINDINIERY
ncbi:hypothetical protein AMATHDRAFT_41832 [Amanita thiersii Skay4041]|uniref:Uncharacterized protein n=1 Tax=Amanita thiersii Skay4041 TaxID=703135 RepID=A0A2A9NDB9_9AGAR|nr:hypothetical protein AMATHDRAFT_41832 [Amanita thiersii Skay4041]